MFILISVISRHTHTQYLKGRSGAFVVKISMQDTVQPWPSCPSSPVSFSFAGLSKGNKSESCKILLNWFHQRQVCLQDFGFQGPCSGEEHMHYELYRAEAMPVSGEVLNVYSVLLVSELLDTQIQGIYVQGMYLILPSHALWWSLLVETSLICLLVRSRFGI